MHGMPARPIAESYVGDPPKGKGLIGLTDCHGWAIIPRVRDFSLMQEKGHIHTPA